MVDEYAVEDFSRFTFNLGHSDIALAVSIIKQLEHVVRKYLCSSDLRASRIPFGQLVNKCVLLRDKKEIQKTLQILAEQRNFLAHIKDVDKFRSKESRKLFVETSNGVLEKLQGIAQQRRAPDDGVILEAQGLDASMSFESATYQETFRINKPKENSSPRDFLEFYCWKMIKINPALQAAIAEDAEGLFEGMLPLTLEEYLMLVPE